MANIKARGGKSTVSEETGSKIAVPGGPPGDGSPGVWTDEYGRLCIGNECFHAAVDQERKEIRVVIDEAGPCGSASLDDIKAIVKSIQETVAQGGEAVFSSKARVR